MRIEDKLLSKAQSNIKYDTEQEAWILQDGYNGKTSTNGTWLYLNEDYPMYQGMVFKANQTIFRTTIVNQ